MFGVIAADLGRLSLQVEKVFLPDSRGAPRHSRCLATVAASVDFVFSFFF